MFRDLSALCLSPALLSCFDGDDGGGTSDGDPPAGDPPAGDPKGKPNKLFTQDEVNKFLADNKRGLQKKLEEMATQLEASKGQDSEALRQKIDEMSLSLKTKEEQAAAEKKRLADEHANKLKTFEERTTNAEHKLRDYMVQHALHSAAVAGEAFNPGQIITQLKGMTIVNEEGDVKVKGLFKTEDDQPSLQDPTEAITWMREHPEDYGNLFKSNVVAGIGGSSAPAGMPGSKGKVDVRKLTPEQYQKLRKENPGALGFNS